MIQLKKCKIRKWQEGDEPFLALQGNNFEIFRFLKDTFPYPYTYDDARDWVQLNLKNIEARNFAIIVDDEPVGSIGFIPGTDVYQKSFEIGYWIGEKYWGSGIASEAVSWLSSYIFNEYDCVRIWAGVFSNNLASMRVLEKCGFKKEAELRNNVFKNGELVDEYIFALLKQN